MSLLNASSSEDVNSDNEDEEEEDDDDISDCIPYSDSDTEGC